MFPSATPATQNEGGCHQVPCLPCKVPRRHRRLKHAQARHQSQPSAISATPVTQNEGGCHQAPRLPRQAKVDVATSATWQSGVWKMVCDKDVCVKDGVWWRCVWKMVCDKVVCERWCVKDGVWEMVCKRWCVTKMVCKRWCVTKMVCKRWCVTKMVCDRWCVKDGVWQSGVWKMVCDKVVCERGSVKDCVCVCNIWIDVKFSPFSFFLSFYIAGGSGTFGPAWSNEAPAIRQDMIEGRLDHVPVLDKLNCWLQFLLTAVLCLHQFNLNSRVLISFFRHGNRLSQEPEGDSVPIGSLKRSTLV